MLPRVRLLLQFLLLRCRVGVQLRLESREAEVPVFEPEVFDDEGCDAVHVYRLLWLPDHNCYKHKEEHSVFQSTQDRSITHENTKKTHIIATLTLSSKKHVTKLLINLRIPNRSVFMRAKWVNVYSETFRLDSAGSM